jgi:hypothetical protein
MLNTTSPYQELVEVVDRRPENRIAAAAREVIDATAGFCDVVGCGFRLVHGHELVQLGNVRWPAGYRMSRCCKQPWDALSVVSCA